MADPMTDPVARDRLAALLDEAARGGYVAELPAEIMADRLLAAGVLPPESPCDHPCHRAAHDIEGPTVMHLLHEPCPVHVVPATVVADRLVRAAVPPPAAPGLPAELRALSEAATPGPWDLEYVKWAVRHIARNCEMPDWIDDTVEGWRYIDPETGEATHADARFIVALVNWFRSLAETPGDEK
jgi:hypothetical protein